MVYNANGGRDVLILAPDPSFPHPEAVPRPRRPGKLTQEEELELQRQGVPPDCQDEISITRARHDLDKRHKIIEVRSGKSLLREEVIESIAYLLSTTQNDGGKDISTTTRLCILVRSLMIHV